MATEQQCRVSSIDAAEEKRIVHLYCGRAEDIRITINEAGDTQFASGQRFKMRLTLEGIQ